MSDPASPGLRGAGSGREWVGLAQGVSEDPRGAPSATSHAFLDERRHGFSEPAYGVGLPAVGLAEAGGEGGIRTPGTLAGTRDFQSRTFDHSVTSPGARSEVFQRPAVGEGVKKVVAVTRVNRKSMRRKSGPLYMRCAPAAVAESMRNGAIRFWSLHDSPYQGRNRALT
jgi:hypothetical protein